MQLIQYKQLFLNESRTKLKEIEDLLFVLEKDAGDSNTVEDLLIALHALKSDAATMSYLHLANAVHSVEELLLSVKRGEHKFEHSDIDNLFMVVDAFRSDLVQIQKDNTEIDLGPATAFILRKLTSKPKRPASAPAQAEAPKTGEVYAPLGSYVEVSTEQLDETLGTVNDIVASHQQLSRLIQKGDVGGVRAGLLNLASKASDMRQAIVTMKMIPVKQYFVFLSRLVRDLARQQKKFITFEFRDKNLRFERQVLESLREICVQLIKNAVDHGFLEGERGRVILSFEFKSDKIYVTVADTGHGIAWDALFHKGRAQRLFPKKAKLTADLKNSLLFEYGLSSKPAASLVSGRGVGLPLVKKVVDSLHGALSFETTSRGRGRGTRFSVTIPLSPTLFRALTWRWGAYYLALPLFVIEKVIQLPHDRPAKAGGLYVYRGKKIKYLNLESAGIPHSAVQPASADAIAILSWEEERRALVLPAGVIEQELIMSTLSTLARFPKILGVAVSEESVPIIILNYRTLFTV